MILILATFLISHKVHELHKYKNQIFAHKVHRFQNYKNQTFAHKVHCKNQIFADRVLCNFRTYHLIIKLLLFMKLLNKKIKVHHSLIILLFMIIPNPRPIIKLNNQSCNL